MIDIATETLLTPAQAARLRPGIRRGRPTHPSTVFRWIARGVRGHRLEAVRLGGHLFTSVEALQRFAERLTADAAPSVGPPQGTRRATEAVAAALDRLGL